MNNERSIIIAIEQIGSNSSLPVANAHKQDWADEEYYVSRTVSKNKEETLNVVNTSNHTTGSNEEEGDDDESLVGEILSHDGCESSNEKFTVNQETKPVIAEKETRQVLRLRISLIIVLVISAMLVGFGAYYYTRYSETSKFEDNFHADATKILQSIGTGVINTFAGLDSFATNLVSHAHATNASFPYVNIPDYANRVSKLQSMSVGLATWTFVVVTPEQRPKYEYFSWNTKRYLLNETLKRQAKDPNYYGPKFDSVAVSYSLVDDYNPLPYNISRNFCVVSQQYPIPSADFPAFNWDWYSTMDNGYFLRLMEIGRPVLGIPYVLPDPSLPEEVENAEYWGSVYKALIDPSENPVEPVSDINYPVYDTLDDIQFPSNKTYDPAKIVGVVSSLFYWRDTFKNILPEGRRGIRVVVDNPCKASFTYQINGDKVIFLGRGDHHEEKYDHLGVHSSFFDLKNYSTVETKYTGIPIDEEFCPFVLNVYPSSELEAEYTSNNPILFASMAVLIFVFTSFVFFLYDRRVESRQKLVLTTAVRSNAVVSALFPSKVRDKILDDTNQVSGVDRSNDKNSRDIKSFLLRRDNNYSLPVAGYDAFDIHNSPPIADLYPETTVFFADIAGFTKWSSTRNPDQVFIMLETLYSSFDKIARTFKIFKVETIGDSYVAVAGLPDPMKNHATVMAKFSMRVLSKMSEVMLALSERFGRETKELNLRIGLNSGPTTAGVLRGEKSRFQLFGDTVNTAARMESNGIPGRIHCTQSTADYLIDAGKGVWITKRDDLVEAKGKGQLQTYWISATANSSTHTTTSLNTDSVI